MAGFGGFGFGQANTNQPNAAGFGFTNTGNNAGGFGANTGGFNNASNPGGGGGAGGLFATAGFGSNPTPNNGFGAAANTSFNKPAFGAPAPSTANALFGANTGGGSSNTNNGGGSNNPGGFGAFGNPGNTTASSGFGAAGGGLFNNNNNNNKPGFGATGLGANPAGGGLFGAGGSSNAANAFVPNTNTGFGGALNNPGIGANIGDPPGTAIAPFQAYSERESNSTGPSSFQNVAFQEAYRKWSPEELRLADYSQGRKHGNPSGSGAFGLGSGFGGTGFGANNNMQQQQQTNSMFATNNNAGSSMFANNNNNAATSTGFGQPAAGGFGASQTGGSGLFGPKPTTTFGATNSQTNAGTGLFGGGGFGNNGGATNAFGGTNAGGGLFGGAANNDNQNKPAGFGAFGAANNGNSGFGANTGASAFGAANNQAGTGLFGSANNNNGGGGGNQPATGGGMFANNQQASQFGGGAGPGAGFGAQNQQPASSSIFGAANQKPATSMFGNPNQATTAGAGTGLFSMGGAAANTASTPFGANNSAPGANNNGQSLFSKPATMGTGGIFGNPNTTTTQPASSGTGMFGGLNSSNQNMQQQQQQQQPGATSMFPTLGQGQQKSGMFGQPVQLNNASGFGAAQTQNSIFGQAANNQQQQQQPAQQQQQPTGFGMSILGASQAQNVAPQGLTASLTDLAAYGSSSLFGSLSGYVPANPGPLATPLSKSTQKRSSVLSMYKLNPSSASRTATPQKRGFGLSFNTAGGAGDAGAGAGTPGSLTRSILGPVGGYGLSKSVSANNVRRTFNPEDSILAPGAFSSSSNSRFYSGLNGSSAKRLVINREMRSELFGPPAEDRSVDSGAETGPRKQQMLKKVSFDETVQAESSDPVALLANSAHAEQERPRQQWSTATEESPADGPVPDGDNNYHQPSKARSKARAKGKGAAGAATDQETASAEVQDGPGPAVNPTIEVGPYVLEPSWEEISNMTPEQRAAVPDFRIGRENAAAIAFKEPVDLRGLTYEDLCGNIVKLKPREASVYPDKSSKPLRGHGLNVPARLTIYQAWPRHPRNRGTDAASVRDHVRKLRKVPETEFEDYNPRTGVWVFSVLHFTTYGVDGSDATDDEDEGEDDDDNHDDDDDLSGGAHLYASSSASGRSNEAERDHDDIELALRRRHLPGSFNVDIAADDEMDDEHDPSWARSFQSRQAQPSTFGPGSSAGSAPPSQMRVLDDHLSSGRRDDDDEYDLSEHEDVTRHSFRPLHHAAELDDFSSDGENHTDRAKGAPGGILRARMRALREAAGPMELRVADGDDWMEMLRKTVSPVKGDRRALKINQESFDDQAAHGDDRQSDDSGPASPTRRFGAPARASTRAKDINLTERLHNVVGPHQISQGRVQARQQQQEDPDEDHGFSTSIDLMKSLFGDARESTVGRTVAATSGFVQWPYNRQDKTPHPDLGEAETLFRQSMKPCWGPGGVLVFPRSLPDEQPASQPATSSDRTPPRRDICIATLSGNMLESGPTLENQLQLSEVSTETHTHMVGGERRVDVIPAVRLNIKSLEDLFYPEMVGYRSSDGHEKLAWELASILFDGPGEPARQDMDPGPARKAKLSQFWKSLVHRPTMIAEADAPTSEEKAIAALSGNLIPDACKHLLEGKNFHLATLIPLIGTSEQAKQDMAAQLEEWRSSSALSEFSQPIRALYELLSGNVGLCDGTLAVPIQDRIRPFSISDRFGLDWKRAFGLRLWYGTARKASIATAVKAFEADVAAGREKAPQPWYLERGTPAEWKDPNPASRRDLLWGLLQLHADPGRDLQAILRPENFAVSPLDGRLVWQLGVALTSTGAATFGPAATEKMDSSALSLAAQLDNEADWLSAVFVLLHLSDPIGRLRAVQELLSRRAASIGPESGEPFRILTEDMKVPASWIWEAQALYMRSVRRDHAAEVQCLIRAGAFLEAHRVLVNRVAPLAVVEQDYGVLSGLVAQFRGREAAVPDWGIGGDMYDNFLRFTEHNVRGEPIPPSILARLMSGLPAMDGRLETGPRRDHIKHAAITCMADEVARVVVDQASKEYAAKDLRLKIQGLPLTSDRRLRYSMSMSWDCLAGQIRA